MSDAKVLPLTPKWEEGIHQFEYTDRMLGYNAATDKDGVANVPARQNTCENWFPLLTIFLPGYTV